MYTFLTITAVLCTVAYLGLRRNSFVSSDASMHQVERAVFPDYADTQQRVAAALSRYDAERQEKRQREEQAYAHLSEAKQRFNEVLVEQRAKTVELARSQVWPRGLLRQRLRQVNGLYDAAMREEIQCARRLYGMSAALHAENRLD